MEAAAIQFNINKESIILSLFYNPPGNIIERDLDILIGTGHKAIFTGDLNAKHLAWRARQNNAAGQSLLNHYYKNNYIISTPSRPTHFPDRNPSGAEILDFAIVSNVLSNHSISTLSSFSASDHSPVLLTISGPLEADVIKPNFIYREANWELFSKLLNKQFQWPVLREELLEERDRYNG
jgi:hypothetical protein